MHTVKFLGRAFVFFRIFSNRPCLPMQSLRRQHSRGILILLMIDFERVIEAIYTEHNRAQILIFLYKTDFHDHKPAKQTTSLASTSY